MTDKHTTGAQAATPPRLRVADTVRERAFWAALLDHAALMALPHSAVRWPLVVGPADASAGDGDSIAVHRIADLTSAPAATDAAPGSVAQSDLPTGGGTGLSTAPDCLSRFFTPDGALQDADGDLLPDGTRVVFDLPDELPGNVGRAVANLAARLGLESGGVTLPLVRTSQVGERVFRVEVDAVGEPASQRPAVDGWLARGAADELALLLERVAATWPHITATETGGAAAALAQLERWLAGDGPEPNLAGDIIWEHTWEAEPETVRLRDLVTGQLLAHLAVHAPTTPLRVDVFASEPPAQRAALQVELTALVQAEFPAAEVRVLSAFKAGLAWLREVVLPELLHVPDVSRVFLRYAPLPEQDGTLDLPIRWLQELFPANELIADALGIPLRAVRAEETPLPHGIQLRVEATTQPGKVLKAWDCLLPTHTRRFIDVMPDAGQVVVTGSGVVAWSGTTPLLALSTPSDRELFWDAWQQVVIPRLLEQVAAVGGAHRDLQPFFGELRAEVWLSEPNEALGLREENDSAAEALAEDIYFTTLDALELHGQRTTGERCNAPGAVVPLVHVAPGAAPHARITLRAAPERHDLPRVSLPVTGIALDRGAGGLQVEVRLPDAAPETLARLDALCDGLLPTTDGPTLAVTLVAGGEKRRLHLPLATLLTPSDVALTSLVPPPMDENIHGAAVRRWAANLAAAPEVTAWVEDHSWSGRPLVAMAVRQAVAPDALRSPQKEALLRPTFLVIARHHANEISSTNAAFQLAWLLAHDPDWQPLLARVNVLLLPEENPDGAALHVELATDPGAETWKHHPARYNAVGFEFGEQHWDAHTRFGESRARTALWLRWPADVLVDNHGVPSHEWLQSFAGYGSPPRFGVSYWIPQALLYGIIRHESADPTHQQAAVALRDAVSAIVRDTDIGDLNREIGASYRFWGQERLPQRFPGEFHDDMLWHISSGEAGPDARSASLRHPRTTVLTWVTEVNDETARGAHLERVARAHLLANRATLDLLAAAAPDTAITATTDTDGRTTWRTGRERPLRLGPDASADAEEAQG